MEFTREAWKNAPEGAMVEHGGFPWEPVEFIGFNKAGKPVVENSKGCIWAALPCTLRIILPKRKVTVQLWRHVSGSLDTKCFGEVWNPNAEWPLLPNAEWTLLGEHTFEIEGE